jgi:type I restriction enzyme M protein
MSNDSNILKKVWSYADILQDEGVDVSDYVQQITNLLFLKMADELTKPPYNKKSIIPKKYNWESLLKINGLELDTHYRQILVELSTAPKLLGMIYRKSQNHIQNPASLEYLIKLIQKETWFGLSVDVKGEIYEGLLEKNADKSQKGAGQYFTPRALISAIVDVIQPQPNQTIADPSCGTGGFFLSAHDYILKNSNLNPDEQKFLKEKTFHGWDIVTSVTRLCAMNMYLHGIGSIETQIQNVDSLIADTGDRFDIVITNPPFGTKRIRKIFSDEGKAEKDSMSYERNEFWATTSNKQLNFLQHIYTMLKINGKCAVVIPDNVLFDSSESAGEIIRKKLLKQCDLHTMLRLPTGIFYAGGVSANVLFFNKKPAREDGKAWTEKLWIYDLRTNMHFTQKRNKMKRIDLDDFVKCYNSADITKRKENIEDEERRWRSYTYDEIINREKTSLDIFWIKDLSIVDLENIPEPEIIAEEISDNLQSASEDITELMENLNNKYN